MAEQHEDLLYHGQAGTYRLLAHRGLAQTFDESEAGWDSNTAAMISEPRHGYIENTIPSCVLPSTSVQMR